MPNVENGLPGEEAVCANCGEVIKRDALGRWAHSYLVRGHDGPWFYCEGTRGTRATPRVIPSGEGGS